MRAEVQSQMSFRDLLVREERSRDLLEPRGEPSKALLGLSSKLFKLAEKVDRRHSECVLECRKEFLQIPRLILFNTHFE